MIQNDDHHEHLSTRRHEKQTNDITCSWMKSLQETKEAANLGPEHDLTSKQMDRAIHSNRGNTHQGLSTIFQSRKESDQTPTQRCIRPSKLSLRTQLCMCPGYSRGSRQQSTQRLSSQRATPFTQDFPNLPTYLYKTSSRPPSPSSLPITIHSTHSSRQIHPSQPTNHFLLRKPPKPQQT